MTSPSIVGVLLYEGCTIAEIAEAATRLRTNGLDVQFVGVNHEVVVDRSGLRMIPGRIIADSDVSAYRAVLVPGGNPDSVIELGQVHAFLSGASNAGALMAGICAGVALLAASGVTAHHTITHNYRSPWCPRDVSDTVAPLWTESSAIDDRTVGVVRDANVITALPNASIGFALAVCEALGVYTAERASLLAAHLKGEFVEQLFEE